MGYPVTLKNHLWLDITSLLLFTLLWLADVIFNNGLAVSLLALSLVVLHSIRLAGWHTPGIWKKPLLWVLNVAYMWLILGFALKAAQPIFDFSPSIAIHAWTVGGIGMMTVGMMARVALGHTGRNVFDPPPVLRWLFLLIFASAVARLLVPLVGDSAYLLTLGLSQLLWIACFALFFQIYFPILLRQRIDGRDG